MAHRQGAVERATRAELRRLGVSVQDSALPAVAVRLSVLLDYGAGLTGAAQVALQLRETMTELARSAVRPEKDAIDELNARRAVRRPAG